MRVVLASASSGRLGVLRSAGVDPLVEVADLDEDALLAAMTDVGPGTKVTMLAHAKATAVATRIAAAHPDAVVLGGDSMLLLDGELVGKPHTAARAAQRWAQMAGRTGELLTGHAVLRLVDGQVVDQAQDVAATTVRFGRPTAADLAAYLSSGEPLGVAGAFTLDGLGGWFVDGIDGDPSNVIGLSLPLLRTLLARIEITVADLWEAASSDRR